MNKEETKDEFYEKFIEGLYSPDIDDLNYLKEETTMNNIEELIDNWIPKEKQDSINIGWLKKDLKNLLTQQRDEIKREAKSIKDFMMAYTELTEREFDIRFKQYLTQQSLDKGDRE